MQSFRVTGPGVMFQLTGVAGEMVSFRVCAGALSPPWGEEASLFPLSGGWGAEADSAVIPVLESGLVFGAGGVSDPEASVGATDPGASVGATDPGASVRVSAG